MGASDMGPSFCVNSSGTLIPVAPNAFGVDGVGEGDDGETVGVNEKEKITQKKEKEEEQLQTQVAYEHNVVKSNSFIKAVHWSSTSQAMKQNQQTQTQAETKVVSMVSLQAQVLNLSRRSFSLLVGCHNVEQIFINLM